MVLVLGLAGGVVAFQGGSLRTQGPGSFFPPSYSYDDSQSASKEPSEFYWSRLRYTSRVDMYSGYGGYGGYGGSWSRDYYKADRQFLMALRRLTRIEARPTEQVVNLDDDDIFNYPWIYAVQVANWTVHRRRSKSACTIIC